MALGVLRASAGGDVRRFRYRLRRWLISHRVMTRAVRLRSMSGGFSPDSQYGFHLGGRADPASKSAFQGAASRAGDYHGAVADISVGGWAATEADERGLEFTLSTPTSRQWSCWR
jgi:hypothetical protein